MALFVGGLAQLLAGMWEFAVGNTFGATGVFRRLFNSTVILIVIFSILLFRRFLVVLRLSIHPRLWHL